MNKQEFDKKYVGEKKVVHCATEELANEFLKEADKHGYKWRSGSVYLGDNDWRIEKEETCYELIDGSYADVDYYTRNDYEIIEFKGFKEEKEMNYIEQVAKMLGVEIGEEFGLIDTPDVRLMFNDIELMSKWEHSDKFYTSAISLNTLLTHKIIKLPKQWKPKVGETYWYVDLEEEDGVCGYFWEGYGNEIKLLKINNIFKTKEEAEQAYQNVLKALKNE